MWELLWIRALFSSPGSAGQLRVYACCAGLVRIALFLVTGRLWQRERSIDFVWLNPSALGLGM